jgi:SNF2 family DNA or RNA helicase
MNIEGNTYLFYDKFCQDHRYQNPYTSKITFNDLYNSDYTVHEGKDAITEFNKFGGIYTIQTDIDTDFYQLSFFIIPPNADKQEIKVFCVCVNHQKLKDVIANIPNRDFLVTACSYHCAYTSKKVENTINDAVKLKAGNATTDPTDPIIEQPDFTKLKLFDYQKRTINWLLDTEKKHKKINYSFNDEIFFGDIVYDSVKKNFIFVEDRKKIEFKGGLLGDEMGLGKTFEMITLSLLNPAKNISYIQDNEPLLNSRATLIMSPNHLSNQWIREFAKTVNDEYNLKVIPLMTKIHHDKTTYLDILDADFIIVSYNFLGNECYYDNWISKISNAKKGQTYINSSLYNEEKAIEKIMEKVKSLKENPLNLYETKPLINTIKFNRIVIDEFHELLTLDKYKYIQKIIKLLKSEHKWVMTGTPFDKSDDCLQAMVEFTTDYKIQNTNRILELEGVRKYILNDFFRKNTKLSVENENKLLPIVEEIIKLKFTPTERAMFNAYIANSNIDRRSVLIRQLCCDPRIVNELKDELSGCKTPEDIQRTMVAHYKKGMDNASKKVRFIKYKIKKCERRIKVTEFRRYRRYLKQKGYRVTIEYPEKVSDQEFDNKNIEDIEGEDIYNDNDDDDVVSDDEDDDKTKPLMIVNESNLQSILKQVSKLLNDNPSFTLNNMKENLVTLNLKLKEAEKLYEGKRITSEFFSNMMNKINKIMEKKKKKEQDDYDSDDDDENDEEVCSICLNEITGEDVGVTKCGHMYCFMCIKEMVQSNPKCPQCMKPVNTNEINMISFEDLSKKEDNKDVKDKITLITKIGTKLANLIFYIKNCKEKCIIFSQWDDLLKKVGDVLSTYGIKNVFCRGNIWTRDKAIRDFTYKNDIQVIMLSSESAAAGTNLTSATKVILLDPVSGSYEYRKNMEGQAIGRAHRTGQTKEVSVVRFIIKDTVEEEIYNENLVEDAKFKSEVKMTMLTDDNINLDTSEIEKIAEQAEVNEKKKELKPRKKATTKTAKGKKKVLNEFDYELDSDLSDDE